MGASKANDRTKAAIHTPGPWSVGRTDPDGDPIIGCFKAWIFYGKGPGHGNAVAWAFGGNRTGREAAEANARLIAAAPEMASALRDCLDEIEAWRAKYPHGHPEEPIVTTTVMNNARALLAKINGEG